jgi:hypothetical protein
MQIDFSCFMGDILFGRCFLQVKGVRLLVAIVVEVDLLMFSVYS